MKDKNELSYLKNIGKQSIIKDTFTSTLLNQFTDTNLGRLAANNLIPRLGLTPSAFASMKFAENLSHQAFESSSAFKAAADIRNFMPSNKSVLKSFANTQPNLLNYHIPATRNGFPNVISDQLTGVNVNGNLTLNLKSTTSAFANMKPMANSLYQVSKSLKAFKTTSDMRDFVPSNKLVLGALAAKQLTLSKYHTSALMSMSKVINQNNIAATRMFKAVSQQMKMSTGLLANTYFSQIAKSARVQQSKYSQWIQQIKDSEAKIKARINELYSQALEKIKELAKDDWVITPLVDIDLLEEKSSDKTETLSQKMVTYYTADEYHHFFDELDNLIDNFEDSEFDRGYIAQLKKIRKLLHQDFSNCDVLVSTIMSIIEYAWC